LLDLGRWLAELAARGLSSEIGQYDHAHQRAEKIRQRLVAFIQQARVQHREYAADDALGRELGRLERGAGRRAPPIDDLRQFAEYLTATSEHSLAGGERLD
jgi:hypothetical protein